ncbi:hypothetical protein C810_00602 [Lachnospiraceae bacterium A2]|nr:hypothetical protein C810_00602 [Lachnospiraceae bacterium A2]
MPRMSKKLKKELAFFLDDRGGAQKLQRTLPEMPAWVQAEFPGCHYRLPPLPIQTSQKEDTT